ncbi:molybdate ABC transporter substrate-binding protein [uncultured Clostridium sp.]|uniref:molybdate ABC transporter substrate-binding protein n=1 Tax=uncultured Clostridium sp. TaxID=59620 RepID=UPI0028E536A1|nr:molybdate ABC transporter substrate-binding protein [uncultured Clostridium sp.]
MKKKILITLLTVTSCIVLLSGCAKKETPNSSAQSNSSEKIELNISAAASLKEAMADIQEKFKSIEPNTDLVVNYGSSGSLQQQIEQGAPCDIFISAGQSQMKKLDEKNLLLESTKKDLVKNELVLIGPNSTTITSIEDLKTDKVKKIAAGEPSSVPAGKYADETFNNLNIKSDIESKLVFAKDVKEVLAWSISGNTDVGFVYLSDALNNKDAKIIETISEESHSPITYPIAIIKNTSKQEASKQFEDFLFTDDAKNILEKYGYKSID